MQICEQFIEGKSPNPQLCEDGLVILRDGVSVIDGVTAKRLGASKAPSGGRRACEILEEEMPAAIKEKDPFQMIQRLNSALANHADSDSELKACIIVYQAEYLRVVSYGDCQCMINERLYSHTKTIDDINARKRSCAIERALRAGATCDELMRDDVGRKMIHGDLVSQNRYENDLKSELGFPVLNGRSLQKSMMRVYAVKEGDEVVLASDGYPELRKTLAESEKALSAILAEDPLLIHRHASTKGLVPGNNSFDDRCYVRLRA